MPVWPCGRRLGRPAGGPPRVLAFEHMRGAAPADHSPTYRGSVLCGVDGFIACETGSLRIPGRFVDARQLGSSGGQQQASGGHRAGPGFNQPTRSAHSTPCYIVECYRDLTVQRPSQLGREGALCREARPSTGDRLCLTTLIGSQATGSAGGTLAAILAAQCPSRWHHSQDVAQHQTEAVW